ncbi:MAG: hypothetical protein OHK0015_56010 [Chloroflexi bacterium OHK40]
MSQPTPDRFNSRRGRSVAIRQANPQDAPALAALFGGLSARSVERRYMMPRRLPPELARREASRLTDQRGDRIVLVATTDEEGTPIVAVAELARDGAEPSVAESAVVVADAYQGEGIGRAVLGRLADAAREAAISHMRAITRADNTPIRQLIASSGRPYQARFAGGEVHYEIAL